jgi:hypothetical protein
MNTPSRFAMGLLLLTPAAPGAELTLENAHVRWTIGADGRQKAFVLKSTGADIAAASPLPFAQLHDASGWHVVRSVTAAGGVWRVGFSGVADPVRLRARALKDHLLLELAGGVPEGADRLIFAQATLRIPRGTVGHFWPIGRIGETHVLLAALHPTVRNSCSIRSDDVVFRCEALRPTGFEGIRAAVVVSPAARTLGVIERLELTYGLPHLTLGGEWFRTSGALREPYLFTDLTARNADRVIEFARRGGFGYVLVFSGVWSTSDGSYPINRRNYPRGAADLKAVADRLHAAGLKFGLHLLSACIARNDPYVTPVPDRRLAVARTFTLAADIDEKAAEVPIDASPAGMETVDSYATRGCDLWIDDEIITYRGYTTSEPLKFTRCLRGRLGTRRAAHKAGATVRYLHRLYWRYLPDPHTDLLGEIAARIARLVNECGADMLYFDGGEAMNILGRGWHDSHWIQRELARRLKREVLITGSGGNGGFGWHTHMRGVANDGVYNRTKRYLDEHKVPQRVDIYHRNLAAAEMGWLNIRPWDLSHPPTQPDEWEYFCLKALAYDAPVSLHMHARFFDGNGRAGECLDIIRRYQRARAAGNFAPRLLAKLRKPGEEFRLIGDEKAGWKFRRVRYGPSHRVEPGRPETAAWKLENPFAGQPAAMRLRARAALRPFGHAENVTLFDPGQPVPWHPGGSAGGQATARASELKTPDGTAALRVTAAADRTGRSVRGWVRHELAKRPDLRRHRSLGLWVHGDGSGAVLDVQLIDPGLIQARDHTVTLGFKGWRRVRLVDPDYDAAFEWYLFRHKGNLRSFGYHAVRELRLQLVNLPKGKQVTVHVGPIEALAEVDRPLARPVVEVNAKPLTLPVTLKADEMAEVSPDGTIRVFDRSNDLKRTLRLGAPQPTVRKGTNTLRLRAQADTPPAYVEPILLGPVVEP